MRVLLLEDDAIAANSIAKVFKNSDIICEIADNAEDALNLLKINVYDVLILDLMLPKINGEQVIQKLRSSNNNIGIIVLSALDTVVKKCECLNAGADDFVTKPVSSKELIARAQAVMRRKNGLNQSKITAGVLTICLDSKIVTINDQIMPLTNKEYAVLELLMLKKGHILDKEIFLNHIYDSNMKEPSNKIFDVFVCKLRKKIDKYLEGDKKLNPIQTAWGRGYLIQNNENE